ncbi:MAG: polyprenyl synthetase family protein [Prevotellaceae bacterium]|jgi:octaprenyl-diphosphate synthase|nr:polyprenyl synthetase family protein [Prevotellaceae bacterium]
MLFTENSKSIIAGDLKKFNEIFSTAFQSEESLLKKALSYLTPQRGKQIRPVLVILSAKICGDITPISHYLASAFELLHCASLIHDDVVDNSEQRRNRPSLNAIFDNKTSVLVGDFLMAKSANFVYKIGDLEFLNIINELTSQIVEGEMFQSEHAHNFLTEADYYKIISRKTAALFSVCTKSGAISANANEQQIKALAEFGENFGMCFQIKDDIFDYTTKNIGKPTFNDVQEGKITLPLLYSCEQANEKENDRIYDIINKDKINEHDKSFITKFLKKYNGIKYAETKMNFYKEKAVENLEIFPDSPEKKMLLEVLNFAVEREF